MTIRVILAPRPARQAVARWLVKAGVPGVNFEHLTTFKSGIKSPYYMDCRLLQASPEANIEVIRSYAALIDEMRTVANFDYDAIAGIQTGAIPFSSVLAYDGQFTCGNGRASLPCPHYSIKKEEKDHGKKGPIDGGSPVGKNVIVVEDMMTTNGSLLRGVNALKTAGATVAGCVAIMSYDIDGANEKFVAEGIPLGLLTTLDDVLLAMFEQKQIADWQYREVINWHGDPHNWHKRYQPKVAVSA